VVEFVEKSEMDRYSQLANSHAGDLLSSGQIDMDDPDDDWCLGVIPYQSDREIKEENARVDALIEEAAGQELPMGDF